MRVDWCVSSWFRIKNSLSLSLRPPRCISWPLESIELSSRKDESSDAHCDHLMRSDFRFGAVVFIYL